MKKIACGILAAALVAALGAGSVFAVNSSGICGGRYVDADGDGVCDYYGTRGNGRGFVDADGDGVCDHFGTRGNGRGQRLRQNV